MFAQVKPELLLNSSPDADKDVLRFAVFQNRDQLIVSNAVAASLRDALPFLTAHRAVATTGALPFLTAHRAVATTGIIGRDVAVVTRNFEILSTHPHQRFRQRGLVWQNQKRAAGLTQSRICKEDSQIFQTGNSRNGLSPQDTPEQYHEATVGEREVGLDKRPTVGWIIFDLYQRRGGWNNGVAADAGDVINRIGRSSIKESDTENSLQIRAGRQLLEPVRNRR